RRTSASASAGPRGPAAWCRRRRGGCPSWLLDLRSGGLDEAAARGGGVDAPGPLDEGAVALGDDVGGLAAVAEVVGDGLLAADLLLEAHERVEVGRRVRRAAGDVDVDGEEVVDALDDAVDAVRPAGRGAHAHGDAPLRVGHLVPDPPDG